LFDRRRIVAVVEPRNIVRRVHNTLSKHIAITPHAVVRGQAGNGVHLLSQLPVIRQTKINVTNAVGYAKFRSRSRRAVIRVYDAAGNVIETHEHAGDFKEW
jgi:hypothetical protein